MAGHTTMLVRDPAHPLFLPNLKRLDLLVHAHFEADVESVEMVASRWNWDNLDSSLRCVTLHTHERQVNNLIEPRRVLDGEGLRIAVKVSETYIA